MRLIALHLERYGAFSGRSLHFREDARLHVVLGPNEAGKSTALAAVGDLLFGFGKSTPFAFAHDMPDLRVGADIAARDGSRLSIRRRKGNKNTLVGRLPDEKPLPEDALGPFLGGLGRDVFDRSFGLDARRLREGGEEMLAIGGEAGASLFAAGSGLRGLNLLQHGLDQEASAIFAPRKAKDRSFYQALERFEDARRSIRETGLREGAWKSLNEAIAAQGIRLDAIGAERQRIAGERARLERLKRVAPLISAIDEAASRAEADDDLIAAGDGWTDRLGALIEAAREAERELSRAGSARDALRTELAAVPEASPLLDHREAILERVRGIERYDKDGTDLPRIQAEADAFAEALDRLVIRIGLPDRNALAERQLSDAQRTRIETLIDEGRVVVAELGRAQKEHDRASAEQADLQRRDDRTEPALDPGPLREELKPFPRLRGQIAERFEREATIRKEEAELRTKAERMRPRIADPAALAAAPLPSSEEVARYRDRFAASERDIALLRQRRETEADTVTSAAGRLRDLEAGRPIASRDALETIRNTRDRAFDALRDALFGSRAADPAGIAAFERAVHEADRIADELAGDATRVATQAAERARIAAGESELARLDESIASHEVGRARDEAAWLDVWRQAGLAPGTPIEMAAWLGKVAGLIEDHDRLERRRIDERMLAGEIESGRVRLAELALRLGVEHGETLDAVALLDRVEARIEAISKAWDASRDREAALRRLASDLARNEGDLVQATARREAWQTRWAIDTPLLGLAPDAGIEEASTVLDAWRDVPSVMSDHDRDLRRVAGMRRDRDDYRSAVARLVELAPDLDPDSPSAAIRTLHQRLTTAEAIEGRRTELAKRGDESERLFGRALRERDEARSALEEHFADLSLPPLPVPEASSLHERLLIRRRLRAEHEARRAELLRAADGLSETVLRAELEATSADGIAGDLARLATEQDANEHEGRIAYAEREASLREREALEGGTGAELAAAQRKSAEAEIGACARQWAVLRLANLMLGTAIARHRAGQQDPMLERAGAIFQSLTGGGFAGLGLAYDDGDEPRIVGRRDAVNTVPVEGMSEGTRDQLYLALRLAYLRDWASRREPAPFLGDDLFVTFDDARTGHGLEALAELGRSVQPILFTHHRHVAELASARLGDAVDLVTL